MVKAKEKDFEDDPFGEEKEFVDEEEDFGEEEEPKPTKRPVRPIEVERTNKFAPKPKPEVENRFVAFHSPAIDGIMDKKTNKLFSQDIMEILADIESKLDRIEDSLG